MTLRFCKVMLVSENGPRIYLLSAVAASCQIMQRTVFGNSTRFKVARRRPHACSCTRPNGIRIVSTFFVACLEQGSDVFPIRTL